MSAIAHALAGFTVADLCDYLKLVPDDIRPTLRKALATTTTDLTGPQFWDLASQAVQAAASEYGASWYVTAPRHEVVTVTLPAKLRSFKSQAGVAVRYMRDHHFPAARFWPGQTIPVDATPCGAVYTGPETVWLCPINQRIEGDTSDHAIAFHWPAELSAWLAQRDQIAADAQWKADCLAAKETEETIAANDDAEQLAEAAD